MGWRATLGAASISVVGPAVGDSSSAARGKAVGGVPTTSLRREVINKMIQENGWIVNDYEKEIGGRQVYVVEAQSQAKNGKVQSRVVRNLEEGFALEFVHEQLHETLEEAVTAR